MLGCCNTQHSFRTPRPQLIDALRHIEDSTLKEMKRILTTLIFTCTFLGTSAQYGEYSIKQLIEYTPLTTTYPYMHYKNIEQCINDNNILWSRISSKDSTIIGAGLHEDMQGNIIATSYKKVEVYACRRFKPIPTNLCPNVIMVISGYGGEIARIQLLSCNNDGTIVDNIEVHDMGFSMGVTDKTLTVKQFILEHGGRLIIYELKPTGTHPYIYKTMSDTQKITAQRKDITYQLNVESGKFVKTSETLYYPQEYEISYYGTNGSDIWEGTETKIGTITY